MPCALCPVPCVCVCVCVCGCDGRAGVHRALGGAFTLGYHWWESVLMAQRLLLAALLAFVAPTQSGVAVLAMCLVCFVFAGVSGTRTTRGSVLKSALAWECRASL